MDWELYQHFNTTLTRKIHHFGAAKLVETVAQYELRLDEISTHCQDGSRNNLCLGKFCFDLCYGKLTEDDVSRLIKKWKFRIHLHLFIQLNCCKNATNLKVIFILFQSHTINTNCYNNLLKLYTWQPNYVIFCAEWRNYPVIILWSLH